MNGLKIVLSLVLFLYKNGVRTPEEIAREQEPFRL